MPHRERVRAFTARAERKRATGGRSREKGEVGGSRQSIMVTALLLLLPSNDRAVRAREVGGTGGRHGFGAEGE